PVGRPGARRDLQPALVAVACVDGPVAAGLALRETVPVGVGRGVGGRGHGQSGSGERGAREDDLDGVLGSGGGGGGAVASGVRGHITRQSFSLCAYEVSCRVRTSAPGRRGGFTPGARPGAGPRVGPVRVPRPRPVDGLVPHRPQGGVRCASDAASLTSLYRTVAARSRIVTIPKCFVASRKRYLGRYQVVTLGLC